MNHSFFDTNGKSKASIKKSDSFRVMVIVCLTEAATCNSHPPKRRKSVGKIQSSRTDSLSDESRCLGKILKWKKPPDKEAVCLKINFVHHITFCFNCQWNWMVTMKQNWVKKWRFSLVALSTWNVVIQQYNETTEPIKLFNSERLFCNIEKFTITQFPNSICGHQKN